MNSRIYIEKAEIFLGPMLTARIIVLLDWVTDRFSEESSWRGIIGMMTAMGVIIDPRRSAVIIAFGMMIIGIINFIKHDELKSVKDRVNQLQEELEEARKIRERRSRTRKSNSTKRSVRSKKVRN